MFEPMGWGVQGAMEQASTYVPVSPSVGGCAGDVPVAFAALEAAALAALECARGADRWDAGTRRRVLTVLEKVTRTLVVAKSSVVTAEADAGTWALKGDRDLAGFLGRESHQGRGAGFAEVTQAATLAALPQVAAAMVDGPVTVKHVREITKATADSPLLAQQLATPDGQAHVVAMARKYDGATFARKVKQFGAGIDPAARQREHDAQRAKRYLTLTHRPDGTKIDGFMDQVTGYKVQKLIDAFTTRPTADDKRPREVRQVDALGALADHVLADKRTTPATTAPVQALITFREETWTALRATRACAQSDKGSDREGAVQRRPGRGSAADVVARLRETPAVVDENGTAWPASEIGAALCDCVLTRVVVDATSQVLDLGSDQRLFSRAQWLAIYASGQTTCAVEGCNMPLRYSELHHMTWWDRDDGPTNLDNAAPECNFHHKDIHRHDIQVTRRPDGSYVHRWPDGRPYGGVPPSEATSTEVTTTDGRLALFGT